MTAVLSISGMTLTAGGVPVTDLPFPRDNVLAWVGADRVLESGGRVQSLTDYEDDSVHAAPSVSGDYVAAVAAVNGINVLDCNPSGLSETIRGYVLSPAATYFGGRDALTFVALAKPRSGASYSTTRALIGSQVSTSGTPMLRVGYSAADTVTLSARKASTGESANTLSIAGLDPDEYHLIIAEIDFSGSQMALEVDGARKVASAFAGVAGQSVSPSNQGLGLLQQFGTSILANSQCAGEVFEMVLIDGLFDDAAKKMLRNYYKPYQRELNAA